MIWDQLGPLAGGTAAPERVQADLRGPRGPDLVELTVEHGLAAQLRAAIADPALLPPELRDRLEAAVSAVVVQHLRALFDLHLLGDALEAAGIRWLAVKGVVLAESLYPSIELRPHGDLDVLVAPEDLGAALEALEAAGAQVVDRNWELVRERLAGQLHLELPGGTLCDLHWDLTHHPETRRCFRLPAADVLGRATPVQVGGRTILTTEPVDTLLHLATHACVSGLARTMWLADLDRLVRTSLLDWDVTVARARASGTGLAVAVALRCTQRRLGTSIPAAVLHRLDPVGVWSRTAAIAARRGGHRRHPDRPGTLELLARSTRDTTRRSMRELASRALGAASERLRGHHPPTGAEVIVRPRGTAADREAFLEQVRSAGHLPLLLPPGRP